MIEFIKMNKKIKLNLRNYLMRGKLLNFVILTLIVQGWGTIACDDNLNEKEVIYLVATTSANNVVAEAGNISVELTANIDWEASCSLEGVSFTPTNGFGADKVQNVTIAYPENSSEEERRFELVFKGKTPNENFVEKIRITQDEKHQNTNWSLVFNEEFEGDAYNSDYWTSYQKSGSSAWNKYVFPNDPFLAEVTGGALHMKARWNNETDLPETGAIRTIDKFSFKYGKFEVKAKFPSSGPGGWPAIWLMPQNPLFQGWPDCGEIDVMERLNDDSFVYQVIHQADSPGVELKPAPSVKPTIDKTGYNTFGIIKSKNKIEFFVNGKNTYTYTKDSNNDNMWPFETDFYLILNYACADKGTSGNNFWPGKVTHTDNFPYDMTIDYVKVWELSK